MKDIQINQETSCSLCDSPEGKTQSNQRTETGLEPLPDNLTHNGTASQSDDLARNLPAARPGGCLDSRLKSAEAGTGHAPDASAEKFLKKKAADLRAGTNACIRKVWRMPWGYIVCFPAPTAERTTVLRGWFSSRHTAAKAADNDREVWCVGVGQDAGLVLNGEQLAALIEREAKRALA